MFPKVISIGDFFLPTYGLMVAIGFLTGLWIAGRLARRSGLDPEAVTNLGVYAAISGLAGAKLLMVLLDIGYYSRNPGEIFSLTTLRAGGVFYGGLIVALVVAFVYMRRRKLPGLRTADVLAPGIALGHAIGRIGCFAAGCCWGLECHRPWAVTFTSTAARELTGVPLGIPLHPTQLYESAAEMLIFGVLYSRYGKQHSPGAIIGLYLVLYPIARFLIEFVRAHQQAYPFGGPLSPTQWIAVGLVGLGVWLMTRSRTESRP